MSSADYRQQLLSVEQACESALSQMGTALAMLNHVDPTQIGTFKAEIDAQFGTEAHGILSPDATVPTESIELSADQTNCTGTISHARD